MINVEELQNFIKIWGIAISSMFYCYYVVRKIPVGIFRFVSLLPILYLFITLPLLLLSSVIIGGPTAVLLVWFSNFKLFLFAFNRGPLAPPLPLLLFVAIALMPIKTVSPVGKSNVPDGERPSKEVQTSPKVFGSVIFSIKIVIFAIIFWSYRYHDYLHPSIISILDCCQVYLGAEIGLVLTMAPVRSFVGVEIEPFFNEPYLSTSLQDFWGRRWNLMVTGILRDTVYNPTRSFFIKTLGGRRQWSLASAFMATFLVSGLMHEFVYYYLIRLSPTWEVTWFFVLHGACTACEVAVKKALNGRWRLHPAVSCPVTLGFIVTTASWLFFVQPIRNRVDLKIKDEYESLARLLLFRNW